MSIFKASGLKVFHICKRYAPYDPDPLMWCGEIPKVEDGPFFSNLEDALRECRDPNISACPTCVSQLVRDLKKIKAQRCTHCNQIYSRTEPLPCTTCREKAQKEEKCEHCCGSGYDLSQHHGRESPPCYECGGSGHPGDVI